MSMEYKNMSDVEYLVYLRGQHEEMKADILECCKGNQETKSLAEIYQYIGKRYHVNRAGKKM